MPRQHDLLEAFLSNEQLEETQSYIERGRAQRDVETDILKEAWVRLTREWSENAGRGCHPQSLRDVAAELRLRREKPPFDRVKKETDVLRAKAERVISDMNPRTLAEINEELASDIERFARDTERGTKN